MHISHYLGLSGIGGVQRNFVEYLNTAISLDCGIKHTVYTLGKVDEQYRLPVDVLDIKNPINFIALLFDVISKNTIVHFYNNIASLKVALFLIFIPVNKLILHERGTIWSATSRYRILVKFSVWRSSMVLANSNATKTMLVEKFSISKEKIKVIHNGINIHHQCAKNKISGSKYKVGYIGRFEAHKGVHILVDAMKYIKSTNIELNLAGSGPLEDYLKFSAKNRRNIYFSGRVLDPYEFINDLDLLVVPSIREPLGNVCLEAGLCKVPVIAANIDGIPEIIKDQISGILLDPVYPIPSESIEIGVSIPDFVVNPRTQKLTKPKQLDSIQLAKKIIEISNDVELQKRCVKSLYNKVIKDFSIERYRMELHNIYRSIN